MKQQDREEVYTFGYNHGGFGDRWACVNYYLHLSDSLNKPILFNSHYGPKDYTGEVLSIQRLLDSPGRLVTTRFDATTKIQSHCAPFKLPYYPTRKKWHCRDADLVCYQFDGRWAAERKNMTPEEERRLLEVVRGIGFRTENLGGLRPLPTIVDLLSRCYFFVGVASGISHVALSVGTPTGIILNQLDQVEHEKCIYFKKDVTYFKNTDRFIEFATTRNLEDT